MYEFDYHKPASLAEAQSLFEKADEGFYLAGGHTLIPSLKQRLLMPSDVIDLAGIQELKGVSKEGSSLRIGALTTHAEVATSPMVQAHAQALSELAGSIGDDQVRHRGTIGGSVANNDPAADYPAALLGFGATVHTDSRTISADDFFVNMFETALKAGELITAVSFPEPLSACYQKFPNPASRYATVGVMVVRQDAGVRVAVTGAAPCVYRATAFEEALSAAFSLDSLDGVEQGPEGLLDDIHASAEYRAHLCGLMIRQAVASMV